MTLLAACPGGNILEPAVAEIIDTDLVPFATDLIGGLSGPQSEVYGSPARFKMLCSGRRFGKTHLCLVQLIVWAAMKSGTLNWYIAPTYKSAKQIAWRQLKAMVPKELFAAKNEVELSIELVNGSRIELKGGESADNLRGASLSNVVLDEAAYIPQDAWEMVIRTCPGRPTGFRFLYQYASGLQPLP